LTKQPNPKPRAKNILDQTPPPANPSDSKQIDAALKTSLQNFWNGYAEPYSLLRESHIYRQLMQQTLELAQVESDIVCLDLACGPGNYACEMALKGAKVVAVDYCERMISIAHRNIKNNSIYDKNISLVQMDVMDYLKTIPDNFFDVVIAALFMSYVKHPDEVVNEVNRVLKPEGCFVMSNPKPNANFSHVWLDSICDILRKPFTFLPVSLHIWIYAKRIERFSKIGVFNFFSRPETYQLLTDSGFNAKDIKFTETFSGQVYLVYAKKSP
jgi:ubiquinone/menaquinone biosynthesis C-methylase UbiE